MTVSGFCYACNKQVETTGSPISCASCGGNFLVVNELNEFPSTNIHLRRILVEQLSSSNQAAIDRGNNLIHTAFNVAVLELPATNQVAIASNSAVLPPITNNNQVPISAGSLAAGFCYSCDKQVPTIGMPVSCSLCGSNFIVVFEIPTINNIQSANTPTVRSIDVAVFRPRQQPATAMVRLPATVGLLAAANLEVSRTKRNAVKPLVIEREQKSKMARIEKENEVEDTCSICFDEWTNSGKHRLVSLKCGHLFGESCIRKWLLSTPKCAQCNCLNNLPDIRRIFARAVTSKNTDDYDSEHKQHMELQNKYDSLINQFKTQFNINCTQPGSSVLTVPQLGPQPIGGRFM